MICGHCGEAIEGQPTSCPACEADPLLEGRYRLEAVVGRGAAGITYRAVRLADGQAVAIKEMPFHRIDSPKVRALFDRETRVLQQLDHPRIPAYVDHFVAGDGRHRSLYLAQAFIDGPTLAAEMASRRYREDEVLAIVAEVADILDYLHTLRPPVIHRDLKPGNLMRRTHDEAIVLVDFGAVRDALADPAMGGSTVVGTYGYMAPEQYRGDASPATDLYALGVTAAVLLTRRPADALSERPGAIDWRREVDAHPATAALLDDLLRSDPIRRPESARVVARRAREAIEAIERARMAPSAADDAYDIYPYTISPADDIAEPPGGHDRPLGDWSTSDFEDREPAAPAVRQGPPWLAIGAVLVTLGLGAVLVLPPAGEGPASVSHGRCGSAPCPPVARGLKGLTFGMTVAEARAALPELAEVEPLPKRARPPADLPDLPALPEGIDPIALGGLGLLGQMPVELPGPSFDVATRIGAFPARCRLDFAVNETLSNMACDFGDFPSLAAHTAAERALHRALVERYGPEGTSHTPPDERIIGVTHRATWTWTDAGAELELTSSFRDFGGGVGLPGAEALAGIGAGLPPDSELAIRNTAAEHADAVAAAEDAARQAAERRRQARQRAQEAALDEARRAIEASKGSLGDDL